MLLCTLVDIHRESDCRRNVPLRLYVDQVNTDHLQTRSDGVHFANSADMHTSVSPYLLRSRTCQHEGDLDGG